MDLYSRAIVGWAMDKHIDAELVAKALSMALLNRCPSHELILHSDRGSQYSSHNYQALLEEHNLICSMSRTGNCYDNAAMESFFHSLKTEWTSHYRYETRTSARASVFEYIEVFYNRQRRHSYTNGVAPMQYEAMAEAA